MKLFLAYTIIHDDDYKRIKSSYMCRQKLYKTKKGAIDYLYTLKTEDILEKVNEGSHIFENLEDYEKYFIEENDVKVSIKESSFTKIDFLLSHLTPEFIDNFVDYSWCELKI